MEKREMIKQIYQKEKIEVDEDYIDNIMKNEKRVEAFIELYEREKIESMNYIIGKSANNTHFTEFELEAMSKINLFNPKMIKLAKLIWQNKDNEIELNEILRYLKDKKIKKFL